MGVLRNMIFQQNNGYINKFRMFYLKDVLYTKYSIQEFFFTTLIRPQIALNQPKLHQTKLHIFARFFCGSAQ
jgi:hypothetical protein